MIKKIIKKIKEHKIIAAVIIVILLAGGYYINKTFAKSSSQTQYVMGTVQKGTLIVSIDGSGQVAAEDQVDLKPSASGKLISINAKEGEQVKKGQTLFFLDSADLQNQVSAAKVDLGTAQDDLDDMTNPNSQNWMQAQNNLTQAEINLDKTKADYDNIQKTTDDDVSKAYQDAYASASAGYIKLAGYMQDLKDTMGTSKDEYQYLSSYRQILGDNSSFVNAFYNDYNVAKDLYGKNFENSKKISQTSGQDEIYKMVQGALDASKAISQALESARHMYDAINVSSYNDYSISSTIKTMQPKIQSDVTAVFSNSDSLQASLDSMDSAVKDQPDNIKSAELAFKQAQEKLQKAQTALDDLKSPDSLAVQKQKNLIAQKEKTLADLQEQLNDCWVKAPFDGVIASVGTAEAGDQVSSGTVLATLITKQKLAKISLNEIDVAKVKVGQKATLAFDAIDGITLAGEVSEVDTLGTASQGVVSYGVKIAFDAGGNDIKPGYSVSASIVSNAKQDVLMVPNSAVKKQGEMAYVQMADLSQRGIQTGISNDTMTEITSGLNEGDQIVSRTITASSGSTAATQNRNGNFRAMGGGTQVFMRGD